MTGTKNTARVLSMFYFISSQQAKDNFFEIKIDRDSLRWQILSLGCPLRKHVTLLSPQPRAKMVGIVRKS